MIMIKLASKYDKLELPPESKQMMKEIAALREEFSKLAVEYDNLIVTVIPNLEIEYQTKIGKKEYELFCTGTEVSRIKRKIELIQAAINRGATPDIMAIDHSLDIEFEKWQEKIKILYNKINDVEKLKNAEKLTVEDGAKLQKLYRELVKRLHPDINSNLTDKEKNLWLRVVTAYKQGDLMEMEVLSILLDEGIHLNEVPSPSLLNQQHKDLKKKVEQLIEQIGALYSKHPLKIKKNLKNPTWVKKQQNELDKKLNTLLEGKEQLLVILNGMVKK
jgi:hypothetical protein